MKNLKIIALVCILGLISVDSFGYFFQNRARRERPRFNQNEQPQTNSDNVVGTPLDGGLLAILAAAGAGYFLVRKKKNKE